MAGYLGYMVVIWSRWPVIWVVFGVRVGGVGWLILSVYFEVSLKKNYPTPHKGFPASLMV